MSLTVSSAMQLVSQDEGADPLVFMPEIDWQNFSEPNIIHAY
jgi:hypothetical protein